MLRQPNVIRSNVRFEKEKVMYTFSSPDNRRLNPIGRLALWIDDDTNEYHIEIIPEKNENKTKTVPLFLDARVHALLMSLLGQTVLLEGSIEIKLNSSNMPVSGVFRLANAELITRLVLNSH